MTGSNGATGRRGREEAAPSGRRTAAPGTGRNAAQRRGGTANPWEPSDSGPCFVCNRARRPAASCEQWKRIEAFFEKRQPGKLMWGRPAQLGVCKDCCIAALDGHRCKWWHLCWGEYPGYG